MRLVKGKITLARATKAGGMNMNPRIAYPPDSPPFGIPTNTKTTTATIIHGTIMPYARPFSMRAALPGPITKLTLDRNSLPQFGQQFGRSLGHDRSNMILPNV
jgi:hypothetical protein